MKLSALVILVGCFGCGAPAVNETARPTSVKNLKLVIESGRVSVSFDPVPGAVGYRVISGPLSYDIGSFAPTGSYNSSDGSFLAEGTTTIITVHPAAGCEPIRVKVYASFGPGAFISSDVLEGKLKPNDFACASSTKAVPKLRDIKANATSIIAMRYGTVARSTDGGTTFVEQPIITGSEELMALAPYAQSKWIVAGTTADAHISTDDGITWTTRSLPASTTIVGAVEGNAGKPLLYSIDGTIYTTSDDGLSFSSVGTTPCSYVSKIGSKYFCTLDQQHYLSNDGLTFVTMATPPGLRAQASWDVVGFSAGAYYAASSFNTPNPDKLYSSPDAITWTALSDVTPQNSASVVAVSGETYIFTDGIFYRSSNSVDWIPGAYNPSSFERPVVVASNNKLLLWTSNSGAQTHLLSVLER